LTHLCEKHSIALTAWTMETSSTAAVAVRARVIATGAGGGAVAAADLALATEAAMVRAMATVGVPQSLKMSMRK
jgi:hypothetical protein